MKVLGFRGDPKAPRYAVVCQDSATFTLENATSDSKLQVPASIADEADAARLEWMYREILRIFDAHPGISKVMVKQNEFTQQDTKAKRRSAHTDAAVVLACAHRDIPVELKIYASMGTTKAKSKELAEIRVARTAKYWDEKMADAVNAAWWGLRR
ncbi:hypothetical protein GCM10007874_00020 [Labrys miyagiensis]|uniref:Holliday junction resolvase RuvC n=1 Tax=Labrys miyagiensis TaxID=346912 RepID=A0ABQ6CBG1_9HYPH|nr:hypothetical protein [Labrys miyagiensis]GLS16987.1 hypothetical protein GCM10007874_00020 [Labrys miyagiensis]